MKKEYDLSRAVRGPVLPSAPGKTRITIRIDDDLLRWFVGKSHASGGGNYQTLMNAALREHVQRSDHALEDALRFVIREGSAATKRSERRRFVLGRNGSRRRRNRCAASSAFHEHGRGMAGSRRT